MWLWRAWIRFRFHVNYKVVQIWPGLMSPDLHTISPGHIWTTLYMFLHFETKNLSATICETVILY